jgi:hypothetical protein
MYTIDFSIFTKMVNIAKQKNLEYIIMYSYHSISSGNYPHSYSFLLSTNLFEVSFKRKFEEGNDNAVRDFIRHNECVELDFDMKIEKDNVELH